MDTEHQKKIKQLFDSKFVARLIKDQNPDFAEKYDLSILTIKPIKRNIGTQSHHVVIQYNSPSFKDKPIFCSSSSDQNRENAYNALTFIQKNGFKNTSIFLPNPILFDKYRNAFFYQGTEGENLLHYIKQNADISDYVKQAAKWISVLHEITTKGAENLNKQNSRIETIVPGPEKFLKKIKEKFPEHFEAVKENFQALVEWENKNLDNQKNLALVHGDFHPENIIINKTDNKVSAIDFTDICVSDYARDIANFIQQFGFMSLGRLSAEKIKHYQDMFLREYFTARNIKKNKDIEKRIQLYSAWTALRSAIYFLLKSTAEPKNANTVLKEAQSIVKQNA